MLKRVKWYFELVGLTNSRTPEYAQLAREVVALAGWSARPGRDTWRRSFRYDGISGEQWLRFRTRKSVPMEYRLSVGNDLFLVRYNYARNRVVKPRRKRDGFTGTS